MPLHIMNIPDNLGQSVCFVTVTANEDGQRLDNFLRKLLPSLPKSKRYKIVRKGEVRINKKRVKPDTRLSAGDEVRIPPVQIEEKTTPHVPAHLIKDISARILFKNTHFMIIDKPWGMPVHGGSRQDKGVIDIIRAAFPDDNWELAHRLDKDTSGCLVLGASRQALNEFQALLKADGIYKSYQCLVKGHWHADQLRVESVIKKERDAQGFERMQRQSGYDITPAVTIFDTLETYAKTTLMQAVIKTGKTHQIRVHCADNKHPIAGDDKYGDFRWNRAIEKRGLSHLFLHAHVIRFTAFDDTIHVSADLPDSLQQFLQQTQHT